MSSFGWSNRRTCGGRKRVDENRQRAWQRADVGGASVDAVDCIRPAAISSRFRLLQFSASPIHDCGAAAIRAGLEEPVSRNTKTPQGRAGAPANWGRIERRASVRAAVRRGLAMGRLVGRRLARRRVVVAAMCERRRRYDRREAATDQKCDELRAHPSLHWSRSTERNLAKSEPGASAQSWPILHPRLSARQAAATTAVLARPGAAGTD